MLSSRLLPAVALVAVLALSGCGDDDGDAGTADPTGSPATGTPLEARDNAFVPTTLTATNGTALTVTMRNTGGALHNFQLTDFSVDEDVAAGQTVTFQITPTKAGSFEFVCKYHTAQKMVGTLTVS